MRVGGCYTAHAPVTQAIKEKKMTPEQELANIESLLDELNIPKTRGMAQFSTYGRVSVLAEKCAKQNMPPTYEESAPLQALSTPEVDSIGGADSTPLPGA
jgi:hypothetical protein